MWQYQAARSKHQKPITVTRSINQWPQYQQQSNSTISFKHASEYYEIIASIERIWRSSNKYKSRGRFWKSSNGYIKHQTQEDIQEVGAKFLAVQDNSINDLVTHWITQYYCQSVKLTDVLISASSEDCRAVVNTWVLSDNWSEGWGGMVWPTRRQRQKRAHKDRDQDIENCRWIEFIYRFENDFVEMKISKTKILGGI